MVADHNPMEHFQHWFYEVEKAHPQDEVNAMTLSTIGPAGFPKNRIVLLKRFTWEGFIFFTNYNSEKGKAITENNKVAISFSWAGAKRTVVISGTAEKIAKNLSEGYFESRPEGSKLGAWVSNQSEIIPSRQLLEDRRKQYEIKFKNKEIPMPEYWGGYLIRPLYMEFVDYESTDFFISTKYTLQDDYNWSKEIRYS